MTGFEKTYDAGQLLDHDIDLVDASVADTLLSLVRKDFQKIPDRRADNTKISLDDALMSALAMFQLKDPSLLAFDSRRREEP